MSPESDYWRSHIVVLAFLLRPLCVVAAPDDIEPPPNPNQGVNQFFMNDENLEANIFRPSPNAQQARVLLETKLKLRLDEMNRVCSLNDDQIHKLKLAASSDIKRFFDEVESVRKKFKTGKQDQDAWNRVWQEIHPLQQKLSAGLFGDNSFFAKTIPKTLDSDQVAKYRSFSDERRRFRYQASVEATMISFEDSVALEPAQHQAIVKLLLEQTPPPLSFGQHDKQYVLYQLSHLPEAKLKPHFHERQWKQAQIQINQHRGLEMFLVQNGVMAKPEPEPKPVKPPAVKRPIIRITSPADAMRPENRVRREAAP